MKNDEVTGVENLKREMGGYLPLELQKNDEYYKEHVLALNSARNAICMAVFDGNYSKIYIPYYLCESVKNALIKNGIKYELYHIKKDFLPILSSQEEKEIISGNACIVIVNYFGIFETEQLYLQVQKYRHVIIDNTQAFYQKPLTDAYNVYSCRKFFGVSDGAYLVKKGIKKYDLPMDYSSERMQFLFSSIEYGVNHEYEKNLKNEEELTNAEIRGMSPVTKAILRGVGYEEVAKKRRENYAVLDKALKKYNLFQKQLGNRVPMIYPLYIEDTQFRWYLIDKNIYVSQWWKCCIDDSCNEWEQAMSKYFVPLPLDQRYDETDMRYLIQIIEAYGCGVDE